MALNGAALAFKGAALAGLVVLGSGCASIHDHRGFQMDKALTDLVQPGVDNRMSVERALGQATFKSQFGPQSWYYVSIDTRQKPFKRPRTTNEQVMKVNFDPAGNVSTVDRVTLTRVPIHPVREAADAGPQPQLLPGSVRQHRLRSAPCPAARSARAVARPAPARTVADRPLLGDPAIPYRRDGR
jgi:outer membrane protein assembly factor BamE (lipoprotein component of BamABCDE complex)